MNLVQLRLVHYYAGVFFAPTIIFFAFSGVMQVFKLHESYRATPGAQGDWIAWMSQVHKESALIPPRAAPAKAAPRPEGAPGEPRRERSSPFKHHPDGRYRGADRPAAVRLSGRSLTTLRGGKKIPDFRLTSTALRSNLGAHTQG